MNDDERAPLLRGKFQPSVPVWTGEFPLAETHVTGSEIRAAAAVAAAASQDPYPTWIHAGLITPDDNKPPPDATGSSHFHDESRPSLQEDEIRELLMDHFGHRCCCCNQQPAWTWNIQKVEDCNAYVGTLETFFEERDVIQSHEPHEDKQIATKGRALGCWEVDTIADFPPLFTPSKHVRLKLPNSEVIQPCQECNGRSEVMCQVCTGRDDSGSIRQKKEFTCSKCHGRGLIAHMDGSDSSCEECKGTGKVHCSSCKSRGLLKCKQCDGKGAFLVQSSVLVKWTTLLRRKVIASCHAASVPDEVFQRAKGVQIFCNESQQCQPATFENSSMLCNFSQEVLADRPPVPPTARIICERHQITLVPVTRVIMSHGNRMFRFYVVGLKKDLYTKDYYPYSCCCSGCSIL